MYEIHKSYDENEVTHYYIALAMDDTNKVEILQLANQDEQLQN